MSKEIVYRNVGEDLCLSIPKENAKIVTFVTGEFLLTDAVIHRISAVFEEEMVLGLKIQPERQSSLQMANTFIPKHLSGNEKGQYLALDLGGTNFRVILLKLDPSSDLDCVVKYYIVPEEVRLGEGELLFKFLADCIFSFLDEFNLLGQNLPLGFCFSFPMIQTGIDEGILVTWTKTFKCKNVVGHEVVQMLKSALAKHKDVDVEVVAVINDATGTMMMGSYLDKRSAIGLILGTGCNASYFERVERIEKWKGKHTGIDEVVVDIEWGAFGDNGVLDFMKTEFDELVDHGSLLVKSFTFEKLFAGKYIGELVKQILLKLIERKVLVFNSKLTSNDWTFTAADVSNTLDEPDLHKILESLRSKGFVSASVHDAEIVHHVCTVVSIRGSLLVSICLASLLRRMNKDDVTIAVDGSLFKLHPKYKKYMELFIRELAPNKKFQLILAEDGSGKGAGLVAAVVTSLDKSVLHA